MSRQFLRAACGGSLLSTTVRRLLRAAFPVVALLLAALAGGAVLSAEAAAKPPAKLTSEERIYKALDSLTQLEFIETPLSDVVDYLKDIHGIEIQIDKHALDDVGIGADMPVTKNLKGITLKSALHLILRELELTYIVEDEVLLITTPEEADGRFVTKVYDVADLVAAAPAEAADKTRAAPAAASAYGSLITAITTCVAPTTWKELGGPGAIAPFRAAGIRALVITHTQAVHEEVAALMDNIRAARHGKPTADFVPVAIGRPTAAQLDASRGKLEQQRAAEFDAQLRKALDAPLTADFSDLSVRNAIEALKSKSKLPIEFDRKAIGETDVDLDKRVGLAFENRPLQAVLKGVLESVGLAWIAADEVVLITTPATAEKRVVTRVYDVADLPSFRDALGKTVPDYDGLRETISSTVAPATWSDRGGLGDIAPLDQGGVQALVISQTQQAHEEIAALLAKLRKARK